MKEKLKIDVVSDIACPWCFVGKKHLEEAIGKLPQYDIEVNWIPFQLDPTIPEEGRNYEQHFINKFGSLEQFKVLSERVEEAGTKAEISFKFDRIPQIPNTLKMHKLLHVGGEEGIGNSIKEAFFQAYFENGTDLSKDESLYQIMIEFGWSTSKTKQIIEDEKISEAVEQKMNYYKRLGVSSVPFFIINEKYTLSGAQPSYVFEDALKSIGKPIESEEKESCSIILLHKIQFLPIQCCTLG